MIPIPKTPALALAGALAAVSILAGTYWAGSRSGAEDAHAKCQALIAERDRAAAHALEAAIADRDARTSEALAIERKHLDEQTAIARRYEQLSKKAATVGGSMCRVDPELVRVWREANRRAIDAQTNRAGSAAEKLR
ncbi:hypothetical protein IAI58_19240 (plasmid) [Roseomonas marmotae]|uniref:hypothetical protein n=1 Tax=Roseomonas marmotae TaxID=2768161 RepID=UPI001AD789FA|nr:hypothetical protein [Roseomonas marmotae]QTI81479.1 hypothetical protein IAI58_19240 [Roseomonas marmotae]